MIERLADYGARAAIVSGLLSALSTGLIVLAIVSAIASAQFDPAPLLARTTIAVSGLAALAAIPRQPALEMTVVRLNTVDAETELRVAPDSRCQGQALAAGR